MRPTTTTMLQQNNNNNYPCLNMSRSPREMLQKCSRGSLLFPSRLELGLGDLPLVRGLRAWALCSKNRKRAGLLGGRQAPKVPSSGHSATTSCPRPADAYPPGEWGAMGYGLGLPLGLDARQAGIGALVTVATLKASEGGGQTQTRCLFLRTEEGSCLYSTAHPGVCSLDMGPGITPTGPSLLVGGWLRGKVGGGGGGAIRDTPVGRRDNRTTSTATTGANPVRVQSGRRWRKSYNAKGLGQEKNVSNREKCVREQCNGDLIVHEKQEDKHKGGFPSHGLNGKQSPGSQQDSASSKQEKSVANWSPRCSHNAHSKTCAYCLKRGGQDGSERHQVLSGDVIVLNGLSSEGEGITKGKQKSFVEEDGLVCLSGLECSGSSTVVPEPDPETIHCDPESCSNCEAGENRVEDNMETQESVQTQSADGKDNNTEEEKTVCTDIGERISTGSMRWKTRDCGNINDHTGQCGIAGNFICRHMSDDEGKNKIEHNPGDADTPRCVAVNLTEKAEGVVPDITQFVDHMALERESERLAGLQGKTGKDNTQTPVQPSDMHSCSEDDHLPLPTLLFSIPVPTSLSEPFEPSMPVGVSPYTTDNKTTWGQEEQQENTSDSAIRNIINGNKKPLERDGAEERDLETVDENKLDERYVFQQLSSVVFNKNALCSQGKFLKEVETEEEKLVEPVNELCRHLEETTRKTWEEEKGPCKQDTEWEDRQEEGVRQMEDNNTLSQPLRQVEGNGEVDVPIQKGFVEIEDVEISGGDLKGKGLDYQSDELNEEYKEEKKMQGEEQEEGSLWEGLRTIKEHNRSEEVRKRDSSKASKDRPVERDNIKKHTVDKTIAERSKEYDKDKIIYSGYSKEESRGSIPKDSWRIKESVEVWTIEDTCPIAGPGAGATKEEEGRGENQVNSSSHSVNPTTATTANVACAGPTTFLTGSPANPTPPCLPLGTMATGLPCLEVGGGRVAERKRKVGSEQGGEGVEERVVFISPEEQNREKDQEPGSTVATGQGYQEGARLEEEGNQEQEDEFGMFMQAEEELVWNEGFTVSASVPCGNRESAALGNHCDSDGSTNWTSGWTDSPLHNSDDTWTAFPQDSFDESQDAVGQWWPVNAVEERRDKPSTNKNLSTVFAEAFPTLPAPSCCETNAIPTLAQLLRGDPKCSRTSQDQGLLDNFHDLNRMIGQRYKRVSGVCRDLLLQSLHLDHTETNPGPLVANHRLSPGLTSSNQNAQTAAAKRRLSYDYNKNIME